MNCKYTHTLSHSLSQTCTRAHAQALTHMHQREHTHILPHWWELRCGSGGAVIRTRQRRALRWRPCGSPAPPLQWAPVCQQPIQTGNLHGRPTEGPPTGPLHSSLTMSLQAAAITGHSVAQWLCHQNVAGLIATALPLSKIPRYLTCVAPINITL